MTIKRSAISLVILLLALSLNIAATQDDLSSTFSYQGFLSNGGGSVNDSCDFEFSLYDAMTGGAQIGVTLTQTAIPVTNGVFTVQLDFGESSFEDSDRYLQIAVRCPAGSGNFTTLSPRQPVTPSPYAIRTLNIDWTDITSIPEGFADGVDNDGLLTLDCLNGQVATFSRINGWKCDGTPVATGSMVIFYDGTFTVPAGVKTISVEVIGGGGGTSLTYWTGKCTPLGSTNTYYPGGGGSGGYRKQMLPVTAGAVYSIVIGLGGQSLPGTGQTGGTTQFISPSGSVLASASGGMGGKPASQCEDGEGGFGGQPGGSNAQGRTGGQIFGRTAYGGRGSNAGSPFGEDGVVVIVWY